MICSLADYYEDIVVWFNTNVKNLIISCLLVLVAFSVIFIMKLITMRTKKRKNKRSYTVVKLIESITRYIVIIITFIAILGVWGVNVTAALAGVGILGLVLGLGAQDLIKDLIAGIGIVMDSQYDVDEIVEINGFKGKVLEIGFRTTRLINVSGEIRIIRNGSISDVTNFSRTFSVAAVLVDVNYKHNIDNVIALLDEKLPSLKDHYPQIIEGPIVAGVEHLANNGVTIKVTAKTNAEEHYSVQRAMNKYIKELFDENNIDIPYSQIVIHEVEK